VVADQLGQRRVVGMVVLGALSVIVGVGVSVPVMVMLVIMVVVVTLRTVVVSVGSAVVMAVESAH
jgi:hypothetical protein